MTKRIVDEKNQNTKILVVAAHPDDEVLGMGGTIAKRSRQGDEIYVLILTEGCTAQYGEDAKIIAQKREQAEEANQMLGVEEVIFADLPDMKLDTVRHVDLNKTIEECVAAIEPELLYTLYPDVNKDHCLTFESSLVAVRPLLGCPVRGVLAYAPSSSYEWAAPFPLNYFVPNVFVNIADTLDIKIEAFGCYKSEVRAYPHPRSPEAIRIYAQKLGISMGYRAAEGFVLVRQLDD